MGKPSEAPALMILYDSSISLLQDVLEIVYGAEEEGLSSKLLPSAFSPSAMEDLCKETHGQCKRSSLGIAVGVNAKVAILHDKKMPGAKPVMTLENNKSAQAFRKFGQNAARYAKNRPFLK